MKQKLVKLLCVVVYFHLFCSVLSRVVDRTIPNIALANVVAIPCLLVALASAAVLAHLTVSRGIWLLLTLVYFRCFLFVIDWTLNRLGEIVWMNILTFPCLFVALIASAALAERTAKGLGQVNVE